MQALRVIQEIGPDGCLHVRVPQGLGKRFELIILPLPEEEQGESCNYSQLQENSGFVTSVLNAPEEDVWNDL